MTMSNKNIVFSAAVRGFHVYKRNWKPEEGELLKSSHEEDNPYDMFSMKVCKLSTGQIVGHLPMEISRITKFIMDRGASVSLKILGRHYRRSPLVQGGLEVPCEVTVTMSGSVVNHLLLTRYETLLEELYIEPKNEEIVGTFLSAARENEKETGPRPRPPKKQREKEVKSRDIRDMFQSPKRKKDNAKNVIVLD